MVLNFLIDGRCVEKEVVHEVEQLVNNWVWVGVEQKILLDTFTFSLTQKIECCPTWCEDWNFTEQLELSIKDAGSFH